MPSDEALIDRIIGAGSVENLSTNPFYMGIRDAEGRETVEGQVGRRYHTYRPIGTFPIPTSFHVMKQLLECIDEPCAAAAGGQPVCAPWVGWRKRSERGYAASIFHDLFEATECLPFNEFQLSFNQPLNLKAMPSQRGIDASLNYGGIVFGKKASCACHVNGCKSKFIVGWTRDEINRFIQSSNNTANNDAFLNTSLVFTTHIHQLPPPVGQTSGPSIGCQHEVGIPFGRLSNTTRRAHGEAMADSEMKPRKFQRKLLQKQQSQEGSFDPSGSRKVNPPIGILRKAKFEMDIEKRKEIYDKYHLLDPQKVTTTTLCNMRLASTYAIEQDKRQRKQTNNSDTRFLGFNLSFGLNEALNHYCTMFTYNALVSYRLIARTGKSILHVDGTKATSMTTLFDEKKDTTQNHLVVANTKFFVGTVAPELLQDRCVSHSRSCLRSL